MGKGSAKKADALAVKQADISDRTAQLAERLIKESEPARKQSFEAYGGLAKGNVPGIEKFTAPQVNQATAQFAAAREAAMALPPGGARDQAIRNVDLEEARAKNDIYSGGVNEAMARLASMAWGGTQAGVGAYGQAGAGYGSQANMYSQQASAKGAMAGEGAGAAGGAAAALL